MMFRRIRIRNVRVIEDLDVELADDVNLVVGPNESGKSTFVLALRAGLFEPHKGSAKAKRELQSWYVNDPPSVSIEFEVRGARYTLTKQFLKGAFARLEGAGRVWHGEDAESQVRELLGARSGGRIVRNEELGFWPLLCVEQGRSGAAVEEDLSEDVRGTLEGRLAAEVGEAVAGRAGRELLERARKEEQRYFTAKDRRPTQELAAAEAEARSAAQALEEACTRRASMRAAAERVAVKQKQLADLEQRLELRERAWRNAAARAQEIFALDARRHELAARVEVLRERRDAAEQKVRARQACEARRAELTAKLADVDAVLSKLAGVLTERQAAHDEAEARTVAAERALDAALARERRAQERLERARLQAELEAINASIELAEAAASELNELRAALALNRLDAAAIRRVRKLATTRAEQASRLDGAAARVRIRARLPLEVHGVRLEAGQEYEWHCTSVQRFDLPSADITISPGGSELPKLRDALFDAERKLETALRDCGVENVAEAERCAEERVQLEQRIARVEERLERYAPHGAEELRRKAMELAARLGVLLPQGSMASSEAEDEGTDLEQARRLAEQARAELVRLRQEREQARAAHDEAQDRYRAARDERDALEKNLKQEEGTLGTFASEVELATEAQLAREQFDEKQYELAVLERRREELGGDRALEDAQQEERSVAGLRQEVNDVRAERERAEGELASFGTKGLHEAVLEAEAEVARTSRRLESVRARAEAARRLVDVLEGARRDLERRLAGPVLRKVRIYLEEIFDDADLKLADGWKVVGLQRGNVEEGFEFLSGGAREQLGVLVRLGLAEVLAGEERLPIILDDALVNTDAGRQAAMVRALYHARRRLQVIVLTCHAHAFDSLGASRRILLPERRRREGRSLAG